MTVKISRVYDDYSTAEQVVRQLEAAGLSAGEISILASNAEGWYRPGESAVNPKHDKNRDGSDDRAEGATTGAGLGVIVGSAAGLLAGLGMLAIPGIGPVVAAGWLASAAAGAGAVGVAGGIVGALAESGVSKENAEIYAECLRRGGAIVTATVPSSDRARFETILNNSAIDTSSRAALYRKSGWTGYDPDLPPFNEDQIREDRQTYRL